MSFNISAASCWKQPWPVTWGLNSSMRSRRSEFSWCASEHTRPPAANWALSKCQGLWSRPNAQPGSLAWRIRLEKILFASMPIPIKKRPQCSAHTGMDPWYHNATSSITSADVFLSHTKPHVTQLQGVVCKPRDQTAALRPSQKAVNNRDRRVSRRRKNATGQIAS